MNDVDILSLAGSLMSEHDELEHWNVRLSGRMKTAAGMCDYNNNTISLSTAILSLWSQELVEDTILHEIAHALTPEAGHGHEWKAMCRQLGAKPERCFDGKDVPMPKPKWVGVCPNGHAVPAHRRTKSSCSRCSRTFDPTLMFQWVEAN